MSIRQAAWLSCIALVAACGACTRQSPPPAAPPPEPQVVKADFYVEAEDPPPGEPGSAPAPSPSKLHRDQPPEVKLALGHYANERRGIGAVVDCTHKVAKLKYDGTDQIIELYGSPGAYDRTDYYKNASYVAMHVYDDGRVIVFLPSAKDGITLLRDADADPL